MKDLIPSNRGLEKEEIGKPFPKNNYKLVPPTTKEQITPSVYNDEMIYTKVISSGRGFLIVETNKGKYKLNNGTVAWRNNNPGNLKYSDFSKEHGAIGHEETNNLAIFPTIEIGKNAQKDLLFGANSVYLNMSLEKAITRYAPKEDNNNPKEYINFVTKKANISKTIILNKLNDWQKENMLEAMRTIEGFKKGTIKKYE